jgi:hypothetical protein
MCTCTSDANAATWETSAKRGHDKWMEPDLVWVEGSFKLELASDDHRYCKASFVPLEGGRSYSIDMTVLGDLAMRPFNVFAVQGLKVALCRRQLVGDNFPPVQQTPVIPPVKQTPVKQKKNSKVHS